MVHATVDIDAGGLAVGERLVLHLFWGKVVVVVVVVRDMGS